MESSEQVSEFLKNKNIPHQILNAKHHEKEAEIIANAGKPGMVTIATNMAGRGTDIVLWGKRDDKTDEDWKVSSDEAQRIKAIVLMALKHLENGADVSLIEAILKQARDNDDWTRTCLLYTSDAADE